MTNVNGMRFTSKVDTERIEKLVSLGYTVQMGTLIAPKDYLERFEDLTHAAGVENVNYLDVKTDGYFNEETGIIAGSIVNIKEKNYSRDFYGRGYVKVLKDGEVVNISYASAEEENPQRNIESLATNVYLDSEVFDSLTASQQQLIKIWAGLN